MSDERCPVCGMNMSCRIRTKSDVKGECCAWVVMR